MNSNGHQLLSQTPYQPVNQTIQELKLALKTMAATHDFDGPVGDLKLKILDWCVHAFEIEATEAQELIAAPRCDPFEGFRSEARKKLQELLDGLDTGLDTSITQIWSPQHHLVSWVALLRLKETGYISDIHIDVPQPRTEEELAAKPGLFDSWPAEYDYFEVFIRFQFQARALLQKAREVEQLRDLMP
jgi:hypothetical protein